MSRYLQFSLLVLLLAGEQVSAKELWEQQWIEVRSPHFVFVSTISEKRTIELVQDLENFRVVAQQMTNIGRFEERIPTTVYVFPSPLEEFGFVNLDGVQAIGYFLPLMRANFAGIADTPFGPIDDTLKHEYLHFLVHNRDSINYPTWFDEGFAELLETLTASGTTIEYGKPSQGAMRWLSYYHWMPFDALLEARGVWGLDHGRVRKFYAQSLLLVHYLNFGRPERRFDVDYQTFLRLSETGTKPVDAFEQAFGLTVAQLDPTLTRYYKKKMHFYRGSLAEPLPTVATQVAPVAADSVAAQLGQLLLIFRQVAEAKRYWDAALTLNPNNTQALVGLADLHKYAGEFDAAPPYYEKAIGLEPESAYHELDYGEYFLDRAQKSKDAGEVADLLTEARRHFARSYKLDPNDPETLAMNGASYLIDGASYAKALESLTAAHRMLPSQRDIKYLLAEAYLKVGQQADAIPLLRSIVAWSDQVSADEVRKLLVQLGLTEYANGANALGAAPVD